MIIIKIIIINIIITISIWYKEEITIDSFNNDDNNFFKENDNKKKVLKLFLRSESSIKYFNKTNTNNNNSDIYDTIKSNIIADINIDSEKTENIDSAAPVEESTSPSSPPSSSSSCRFKGTSVADLEFLDVCKNQRDMFEVWSYRNFNINDKNYLNHFFLGSPILSHNYCTRIELFERQ